MQNGNTERVSSPRLGIGDVLRNRNGDGCLSILVGALREDRAQRTDAAIALGNIHHEDFLLGIALTLHELERMRTVLLHGLELFRSGGGSDDHRCAIDNSNSLIGGVLSLNSDTQNLLLIRVIGYFLDGGIQRFLAENRAVVLQQAARVVEASLVQNGTQGAGRIDGELGAIGAIGAFIRISSRL